MQAAAAGAVQQGEELERATGSRRVVDSGQLVVVWCMRRGGRRVLKSAELHTTVTTHETAHAHATATAGATAQRPEAAVGATDGGGHRPPAAIEAAMSATTPSPR